MADPEHDPERIARWRLVLGKAAEQHGITCGDDGRAGACERALGFVFDDDRQGGAGGSQLAIPSWIDAVSELFPRQAKEVLERELIRRRGISDLLDHPQLLEKIEPNVELVKTLLTHKDLLTPKTRVLARKVIDKVVQELKKKLEIRVEQAIQVVQQIIGHASEWP